MCCFHDIFLTCCALSTFAETVSRVDLASPEFLQATFSSSPDKMSAKMLRSGMGRMPQKACAMPFFTVDSNNLTGHQRYNNPTTTSTQPQSISPQKRTLSSREYSSRRHTSPSPSSVAGSTTPPMDMPQAERSFLDRDTDIKHYKHQLSQKEYAMWRRIESAGMAHIVSKNKQPYFERQLSAHQTDAEDYEMFKMDL